MAKNSFISFEFQGLKELLKDLDRVEKNIIENIDADIQASADTIAKNARRLAPADEGLLKQSISSEKEGTLSYEVVAQIGYAIFREFGTGNHVSVPSELQEYASQFKGIKGGSWKEFQESIKSWCSRHGIPEEAVYPIMAKIIREGTEPTPFLFPAYFEERKKLLERLRKQLLKKSLRGITVIKPGDFGTTGPITTI